MSNLAILGGAPQRTLPFSPWPQYTADDLARLHTVLESRNWGGYPFPNQLASEFAHDFAEYHGAKYGCCVVNGTIALLVALQAAGIKFGDEVIVPAYTWDGTAAAVLFAGGVPVFADIDPDTYCLDIESARRAITPRTRAIIPVHLAMRFADMDALVKLAREHKLAVIEDCAHVHGGEYQGHGAGSDGRSRLLQLSVQQDHDGGRGRDRHHLAPGLLRAGAIDRELRPRQRYRSIQEARDRLQLSHHRVSSGAPKGATRTVARVRCQARS